MHHDNNLVRKKNSVVSNIECIERYIHYVNARKIGFTDRLFFSFSVSKLVEINNNFSRANKIRVIKKKPCHVFVFLGKGKKKGGRKKKEKKKLTIIAKCRSSVQGRGERNKVIKKRKKKPIPDMQMEFVRR